MTTVYRIVSVSVPLLLFTTLAAWAFASAVGASPDDDFHLASIWCGLGLREGLCEDSGDPTTRLVPAALIDATCYIRDSAISGACWDPTLAGLGEATWLNTAALYPPVFYAAMSVFASADIQSSVLLMRLSNAALAVGFVTAVFFALPRHTRPALLVSLLATIVPLGIFIFSSTNPSSWALISAATVWICLYGALMTTGRRQVVLCVLTVAGTFLGAGARADSAIYAVFGVCIALLLGAQRGQSLVRPIITSGFVAITSVLFFVSATQGASVSSGLGIESEPLTAADHISNVLGIPGLWLGVFGGAPLGWLDTSMPYLVPVLAFGSFCAALAVGIRVVERRRVAALLIAAAALWVTPFILLAQSDLHVADNLIQPRYVLPLMVILLGIAALAPRPELGWSVPRVVAIGAALSIAASLSLHINIRRYTTGADEPAVDPGSNAEWWWVGAPSPLFVWVSGSVAFALVFVLLAVLQHLSLRSAAIPLRNGDESAQDPVRQPSMAAEGSPAPRDPASDSA